MALYTALQRESGRWDYTCTNSDGSCPVGYCAEVNNGHHETQAEAFACYRRYQIDKRLRLDGSHRDEQHPCAVCSAWTQGYAWLQGDGHREWPLCDEHRTRESVEHLWKAGAAS